MPFKTTIETTPAIKPMTFPVLRQLNPATRDSDHEPVVILFTDATHGIALSGVREARIGKLESWSSVTDAQWIPVTITLSSED